MSQFNERELENNKYQKYYSKDSFWEKLGRVAKKVGFKGIFYALTLYYVLQKEEVSKTEKAFIIGALGYFIFPLDLIPDLVPGVGYTDDFSALAMAFAKVAMHIDEEVKLNARNKMKDWFSSADAEEVKAIGWYKIID